MAFTGTAVIEQVSDNLVRITGLSLADLANGTIGLHEKTAAANVTLPEGFKPRAYDNAMNDPVSLQDSIQVSTTPVSPGVVAPPIMIVKTGTTKEDFVATLTSNAGAEDPTGDFEIYVRFH